MLIRRAAVFALLFMTGCASTPSAPPRAGLAEVSAAVCPVLADQEGSAALEIALLPTRWTALEALSTVECSYVFVDGGASAPAGHHIVARYNNHELIDWISARYGPEGARSVFGREGVNGDAMEYLDDTILYFTEVDPPIAEIFEQAQGQLEAALEGGAS
ncbi:MAG: hypothetical protein KTR21_16580 [Rhodobacteraceae bacterium]|nr:hypothetical protein [Paracoccaceae bacterium]